MATDMTDKQLLYINRLTVFVRKLLKLVPQEKEKNTVTVPHSSPMPLKDYIKWR